MLKEPKLVLVEFIDPVLRRTRGEISVDGKLIRGDWFDEEKAIKGEKKGKWKTIGDAPAQKFETKIIPADSDFAKVQQKPDLKDPHPAPGAKRVFKTQVAWIQDQLWRGGAEISGNFVAEIGRNCGFDIAMLTRDVPAKIIHDEIVKADLAVLNNLWAFSSEQIMAILKGIYSDGIPYVKYEHDHREISRPEFSIPLFRRSKLNVFLSPMHLRNYQKALGCDGIALPLAIDTEIFKPVEGVERKAGWALVSNVRNFKSWQKLNQYIQEHPEITFVILGSDPPVQGQNIRVRPMVPFDQMPALYSEHEFLVHILDGYGAGERVVFEAALCGCKIIMNENVGHMSWEIDLGDTERLRQWLDDAPFEFWRRLEAIV